MSLDGVTDSNDVFVQISRFFTLVTNDDEIGPYTRVSM